MEAGAGGAMDTTDEIILRKNENSESESEKLASSSDELSEDDSKLEEEAATLEKQLAASPWDYESHVRLVRALRTLGELPRLRAAREEMSRRFPLTPALWLEWLADEVKLVTTEDDRTPVEALFERAVNDYTSVDVWLEYAGFALGALSSTDGAERARAVFERGLTAAGLDVPRAALLWDAFREFEAALAVPAAQAADSDADQEAAWDRVLRLFRRQLAVPLRDMAATRAELTAWLAEAGVAMDTANVDRAFKRAQDKLAKIEPFEQALEFDDSAGAWRRYIEHEWRGDSEPARITALYERALAGECAVEASLWLDYVEYLARQLKVESVLVAACKRAVRNCPWSSALWQECLRAMERGQESHDAIKESMEVALAYGMSRPDDLRELWLAFLDYLRRRTDFSDPAHEDRTQELLAAFERAIKHLDDAFGADLGDPGGVLLQRLCRVQAVCRRNPADFRAAMARVLAVPALAQSAAAWLELASLERTFGDAKQLRRLFARGLKQARDWPESVGTAWLNFERDAGSLDEFETCLYAFRARVKDVTAQRAKAANAAEDATVIARRRGDHGNQDRGRGGQEKGRGEPDRGRGGQESGRGGQEKGRGGQESRRGNPGGRGGQESGRDADEGNRGARRREALKRRHDEEGKWASTAPRTEVVAKAGAKVAEEAGPPKRAKVAPPPGYRPPTPEGAGPVAHDSSKDERTVFVSNLDFSVTDLQLHEAFTASGAVTDIRLVSDFKGRSKGFCYVEFESAAEATLALARDRELLGARPMFVSRCDPDQQTRKPVFKYSAGLEKNKLFVKGLPLSMTKAELELMFGEYGKLREVRLVTFRNGHSKGLAYVEFEATSAATAAVLGTDGREFGDRVISVAISQPPERRAPESRALGPPVASLGGGGDREVGSRGRVKMAASLVPRAVQISRAGTAPPPNAPAAPNGANGAAAADAARPLSNQDFRQMLLGAKK